MIRPRLATLRAADLLDKRAEAAFDRLTRLAVRILGVPISLVSLVTHDRQIFKSAVGLPEPLASTRETPLSYSFCKHVVLASKQLIVPDARHHPLLKDNPAIATGVIAYAGFPIRTSDGHVLGSFCAVDSKPHEWREDQIEDLRDLAASCITEVELRLANDKLRQEIHAKDRFIATLSHDLRTPLSPALMTAAELAGNPSLSEPVRNQVRLIQRNIKLQVRMIDSLLDITRLISGKMRLSRQKVDVHGLLQTAVETVKAETSLPFAELKLDLQAQRSEVEADAEKLLQVFGNLLNNAFKFSRNDARIAVRTRDEPDDVLCIEVSDQGVGISPGVLPLVFDPFDHAKKSYTHRFGGLGLGLAICKGIIDLHGGTIEAASEGKGKGTTIAVRLKSAVPSATRAPGSPIAAGLKPALAILVVEEHEDTLRVMSELLKRHRHEVTAVTTVSEAIDAARQSRFDLLISDTSLPDGSAAELFKTLKATNPIRGVALTGYGVESNVTDAQQAGFDMHLTKPVDEDQLLRAIAFIHGTSGTRGH